MLENGGRVLNVKRKENKFHQELGLLSTNRHKRVMEIVLTLELF